MKMNKIVSLVVALVMVVSASAYAFASSPVTPNYPWVSDTTTTTPGTEDPTNTEKTTEEKIAEVKAAYEDVTVRTRSSIVTVSGKKAVALRWTLPSDAPFDGYVVYKSTKRSSGYKAIKTITKASTKSYTDKNVKAGKKYYYMVKTYKLVDGVKVWSTSHIKAWRTVK